MVDTSIQYGIFNAHIKTSGNFEFVGKPNLYFILRFMIPGFNFRALSNAILRPIP